MPFPPLTPSEIAALPPQIYTHTQHHPLNDLLYSGCHTSLTAMVSIILSKSFLRSDKESWCLDCASTGSRQGGLVHDVWVSGDGHEGWEEGSVRAGGSDGVGADGTDGTDSAESATVSTEEEAPAKAKMEETFGDFGSKKRDRKVRSRDATQKKSVESESESEGEEKVNETGKKKKKDNGAVVDGVSWYKAFKKEMEVSVDRWTKTNESNREWLRKFKESK